jgi:hypothetical protein
VRRITDDQGIPVLPAPPKGVRKENFVQPLYRRLKGAEGVACILTSLEQGRTFVSYTPRYTPPSGDANYRLIKACRKRFLHYYWLRARPNHGSNERARGQLLSVQRHLLLVQRPRVRGPGTDARRGALP